MDEQLQKENQLLHSLFKQHEEIKMIVQEEKKLHRVKQETNALLCKMELLRMVKTYLLSVPRYLSYAKDEKSRVKALKIVEKFPFKSIHKNLESIDKKADKINKVVVTQQNEHKYCAKFINKRIVSALDHNKLKLMKEIGMNKF